jgi:biopolymer transport protein ExbD
MAEVQEKEKGGKKKGKQKKMRIHVDFTPMVDMNMLLICFFMLATSMSKPQIMKIIMPSNKKDIKIEDRNQVEKTRAVTVLLGENNELYYYEGQPDYANVGMLKVTNYSATGFRAYLINRNKNVVGKINALKKQRANLEISEEDYLKQADAIKEADKTSPIIVIKASDKANYKNLVDVLDEMQICSIATYAIVDILPDDLSLIERYKTGDTSVPPASTTQQPNQN